MSYNDCRHGAEMCDQCLDIMGDGIRQGAEQERERIIALLEAECFCEVLNPYESQACDACEFVALIKGDVAERRQSQMNEYGDKGENK